MARHWWCGPMSLPPVHLGEPSALGLPTVRQSQAWPIPYLMNMPMA